MRCAKLHTNLISCGLPDLRLEQPYLSLQYKKQTLKKEITRKSSWPWGTWHLIAPTFFITQWYPWTQSYDTQVSKGRSVAAETSKILIKFDKKQRKEQANFPFALTRHHVIYTCDGTKTSSLNYITLKHATGRARLTKLFGSDYGYYLEGCRLGVTEKGYGLAGV